MIRKVATDKEVSEELQREGSWVQDFDVWKMATADGYVRHSVYITGTSVRVWIVTTHPHMGELMQRWRMLCTADWRRRGVA